MEEGLGFLLEDAKSVALYGSRSGKLTSATIFLAISRFEQAPQKTWSAPETANLQTALAQAVADIAPVTLVDLRLNNPFSRGHQKSWKRYVLICISILLMALTAHLTVTYNKQKDFVSRVAQLRAENPYSKLGTVARAWRDATASNDAKPTEAYFIMLDEIRSIDRVTKELTYISEDLKKPWYELLEEAFWPGSANYIEKSVAASESKAVPEQKDSQTENAAGPGKKQPVPENPSQTIRSYCGVSDSVGGGIPVADKFFETGPGKQLLANRILNLNFSCAEGFYINPETIGPILQQEQYFQQLLALYSQWLLPALYAALGSLVYYMRSVLNPTIPDPGYEHIAHRVALGAFSGIIFAWFWSPGSGAQDGLSALTVNSFAVAFIIGFSIDIFFTALDRFVSFMQNVVAAPRTHAGIMEIPFRMYPQRDAEIGNVTNPVKTGGTPPVSSDADTAQISSFPR